VFRSHCATCHGRNAEGFRGPNLTTGQFRHGRSDDRIFRNILEGISGTGMGGVYLPDAQIWQVISYVRSLAGSGPNVTVQGDKNHGREIFENKGECITCHVVGAKGGRRGTNLTSIGWQRSITHLAEAIADPSKSISSKFRFVQIDMKRGEDVEGILLNEDTYSVQLMDGDENLISLAKEDIDEINRPKMSLMPEYADSLSDNELADLVAYLHSLKGVVTDE